MSATEISATERALAALKDARVRLEMHERQRREPIAIVGMGCRFPGGGDGPEAFWRELMDGVDAVGEVPTERWDAAALYDPDPEAPGKSYTRHGAYLRGIDMFDAAFFGISPREASAMDPQQRLLLEVAWEALEDAGHSPQDLGATRAGVFVGTGQGDYAMLGLHAGDPARISQYDGTGTGLCFVPGRLSYVLGLQGPSLAVDTACSSSLVALHLACQSLRNRECDMALAGGVHLSLSPDVTIFLSRTQALSADGRCRAFDAAAGGFGRGEGCGAVVLKRLSDAERAGDRIVAVVLGSAVNHDGPSGGLTVPNQNAQEALVRAALERAKVAPGAVGYIECHGTGTVLGDPIEAAALAAVFAEGRKEPLVLGSVKTNLGHLEAAAGIAGLMKAALAVERGTIPPQLHFREGNPRIDWARLPFRVPTATMSWPVAGRRVAGVSSFGMSGTNAHVVLAAHEGVPAPAAAPGLCLLVLSAKTEAALGALAGRHAARLAAHPDLSLADVAWTLAAGRGRFAHWLALEAATTVQAADALGRFARGEAVAGLATGHGVETMPRPDMPPARRVALPTYPFERRRYWSDRRAAPGPTQQSTDARLADMFYRVGWQARPLPKTNAAALGDCLMLADRGGVGAALAAEMERRGARCRVVQVSDEPPAPDGLRPMLEGRAWRTIVNLSALDAGEDAWRSGDDALAALRRPVGAIAGLASTIEEGRLWLVTRGVAEGCSAIGTAITGLGRSIAAERPEIWGGAVDLAEGMTATDAARHLADELSGTAGEDEVAYASSGERRVARLERVPAISAGLPRIRPEAIYLITGGLGALGLTAAEWLVARGARHVVLMGRNPPKEAAAVRIDALRQAGTIVDVVAADVTDARRFIELVAGLPRLTGIVHAAGILDDGLLGRQSWERLERVLAPKVVGAWTLAQAAREQPLEWIFFFSSAAAMLGSAGQAGYAAANGFMDGLARRGERYGPKLISVGWGPWAGDGMAGRLDDRQRARLAERGVGLIGRELGFAAFDRALASDHSHVGALLMDWTRYQAHPGARRLTRDLATASAPGDASPPADARALVADAVRRVLGLPSDHALDEAAGFFDLGMDSMMAVELRRILERRLGRSLPATLAFSHATIGGLTAHLEREGPGSHPPVAAGSAMDYDGEIPSDADAAAEIAREYAALVDARRTWAELGN